MAGIGATVALIKALAPKADPATIEQAVQDWLDDHPEATTTVEDGSITEAKLAADVAGILYNLADKITYSGYVAKNGTVNSNSNDTKRTTYLPVKANDLYYYDLRGIDNFSIIAFFTSNDASTFDAEYRVVGNGSDTHKTGIYTIPQNGYIIITSMNSYADHAVFAKVGSLPSVENRLYQAENEIDTFDAYFENFADKITVAGYVANNGSVISNSSDTKRTTYLPVKSGEKFYYNLLGIDNFKVVAFFASDKTYVSGITGSTGIASIGVATAPQDGFVIFTSMNKYAGTACACYYDSFRRVQSIVNNDVMLPDLTGKNILNFGDSLANGAGWGNKSYADLIATETGATLLDCSGSGNAFARLTNSDGYGCVVNQVKNAIVTYAESDVPIIFVEGGINDLKQDTFTIGDMTYSYEGSTSLWGTLIGACDYIFYSLRNTFPSAKIVFVMYHHMPIQNTEAGLSYEDIDERQDQQHEAFLKVCAKWGIPVADVYAEGQLNAQMEEMAKLYFNTNVNEKWGRDIAHPNGLGYKRFYVPLIRKKLQQSNG